MQTLNKKNSYYFIGIGGAGMSALANILAAEGYKVAGSDLQATHITKELEKLGIQINYTQVTENITDDMVIIHTDAVSPENLEYQEAIRRQLKIYKRPELLSILEKTKEFSIAVSGAHGKTTTSSIVAYLLTETSLDPTCVIGGILPQWNSNARIGSGKCFVYEACEAFGNLIHYHPTHLIVTNIDKDHLEHFDNSYQKFKEYFVTYINRIAENKENFVLLNYDDAEIKNLMPNFSENVRFFSLEKSNLHDPRIIAQASNLQPIEGGTGFFLELFQSKKGISVTIPLYGKHNVEDAVAALVMCSNFMAIEKLVIAIKNFQNSQRRFELVGKISETKVYTDYAHLPAEVASVILGAKQSVLGLAEARIIAVFQPHLPSRTKENYTGFAKALLNADLALVTPVYCPAGREANEDLNIKSELIYNEMQRLLDSGEVKSNIESYKLIEDSALQAELKNILRPNDLLLLIGAGTIGSWHKQLCD
ncbi:MAG: UDP-N-acetylmuramate--L-alanine ligase [Deltaproteobacteria bacterium]|jgi:UDP-N-acetylmuramate--alanine ligase|nr:UDP-N-acetylmuramate--L-alanine ligase [Deltaproteobacteria bacterium]